MKKITKILSVLMVITLIVSLFGGCVNTSSSDGTTAGTTAAPASEAISDGVLTVGTNAEFSPFEYMDDSGNPDGFDMALIKEIGKIMGVEVVIENMEFKSLLGAMGKRIDVIAAAMTVDDERKEAVDFSNSYYTATQYVLVKKGSGLTVSSQDDLKGKRIGVQEGTTGDYAATDDIKNSQVSRYKKGVDAVIDLNNGRLDAVIIDSNPAQEFAKLYSGVEIAAKNIFAPEDYAIAIPKGDTVLAGKINDALATLKENGKFDELVKTYINK